MAQLLFENYMSISKANTTRKGNLIAGTFSKADLRNENGRKYTFALWEKKLSNPAFKEKLRTRRVLGELGHPDIVETTLRDVSHIVTYLELRPDGTIYGEAEILDTPSGKILKTLYDAGVQLGISSRGYLPEGSNLIPEGEDLIVPDDYELITFDFVIDPSSQGAFPTIKEGAVTEMKSLLTESKHKINSDVIKFIGGLGSVKPINPNMAGATPLKEGRRHSQSASTLDRNNVNKGKEVPGMHNAVHTYTAQAEKVIEELRNRYTLAEQVISEMTARQHDGEAILNDISKRYLSAEKVIEEFAAYSRKLEDALAEVSRQLQTAEAVIGDLASRYTISEDVLNTLMGEKKLTENIIADLKSRYTLAEDVIAEMRDLINSGSKTATNEGTTAQRLALSESVIAEMRDRLNAPKKRTPIPAGYFEGVAQKYGVSVAEAKSIFKSCGRNKAAFEYHLEEKKRLATESRYAEVPYMLNESRAVTEQIYASNSEAAKVARLVAQNI